ncbi:16S rRNA (guanine(966)-N(2))-methyltransferase RsmD [Thiolinea disciformis]|uniref:16S rRNA (guanine(966)-N(2))-methyltransferase RsmD n=1 Tax=Thiolinea disciformis TaxID=125614 RepID=UPI00035FEB7B|nr:16S rRNA (guanine(966)-N(2))-methyltransferase RsmD [Thiolinea disciformis]
MESHKLRIIGGEWRSRRLPIAEVSGLRPTPDRIRETLFNWLQFEVQGAFCLDLFAGSGALGFEALSRGALHCSFVEKHPKAFAQLKANVTSLKTDKAVLYHTDALQFLQTPPPQAFNLIFLDPPFRQALLAPSVAQVCQPAWLKAGAWIYAEHETDLTIDWQNFPLRLHRQSRAGQVVSVLLHYQTEDE